VDERAVVGAEDLFPTFCSLAGVRVPKAQFDGEDMSPAFRGREKKRSRALMWEYDRGGNYIRPGEERDRSPNLAIRDGRWKLLVNHDGSRQELYDFTRDHTERDNVAARHQAAARDLTERLMKWRASWPKPA
jgi:arylsulfatase A-like enzyme